MSQISLGSSDLKPAKGRAPTDERDLVQDEMVNYKSQFTMENALLEFSCLGEIKGWIRTRSPN